MVDKSLINHNQNIIKARNSIYVWIDGTGVLYKYNSLSKVFTRLDSTIFWGYNLGAFSFTFKDSIYNLGGSGLWRTTGHLRVFNPIAHEWDIVPLNQEIPISSSWQYGILWYDINSSKIYSAFYFTNNDGIKANGINEGYIYKVMVLDLKTKEWNYLGELNESLRQFTQRVENVAMLPWGLLGISDNKVLLWDFQSNKEYQFNNSNEKCQTIFRKRYNSEVFTKDSTLFFYNKGNIDSLTLNIKDFSEIADYIYQKPVSYYLKGNEGKIFFMAGGIFFILGIGGLSTYKKRISKKHSISTTNSEIDNSLPFEEEYSNLFSEQELLLIEVLYKKTLHNRKASIEEINIALGLLNRSSETQKQQRHKLITSINTKYSSKAKVNLIDRQAAEFDKRVNEYFIVNSELNNIKHLFPHVLL